MDCNFEFDFQGLDENRMKRMLGAQSLWDATMAHSVTKALYRSNLVVHIAGYFHVKQNLEIPEHIAHYCTAIDNEHGVQNYQVLFHMKISSYVWD